MKLIEINWDPPPRQLRQFAVICFFVLPFLGWLWGAEIQLIGLLAGLGLLIALVGFAVPAIVKPIFIALTVITTPIGMVVGEVAMGLIYYGVFLPIGCLFRLQNKDALRRKIDSEATTYWQEKKKPKDVASYYRQS